MYADIDYERLYRDTIPSVVSIYVGRRAPAMGAGSGFVYDVMAGADGYVVTNDHVVADATDVEVRFADGQWRTGRVVGRDAYTDLAVVRIPDLPAAARPLPVAADNPTPGRPVAALGNPLGLDGSITAGIVSGANRSMPTSSGFAIPDVVQTDAPINPGNSGGPLVALSLATDAETDDDGEGGHDATASDGGHDATAGEGDHDATASDGGHETTADDRHGPDVDGRHVHDSDGDDSSEGVEDHDAPAYEVVGVNRARQGDNIGFAVSPAIVTRVVPSLIEEGRYRHSYLRTRTLDVTPTVAEANGLDEPRGVLVVDVATGPTAGDRFRRSTGVRTVRGQRVPTGGDVIVGLNGRELRSHEELMRYLITETRPREPVDVDVVRDGEPRTLSVVLGERPDPDGRIPVN
jgi:S1-C subfamily serine protease